MKGQCECLEVRTVSTEAKHVPGLRFSHTHACRQNTNSHKKKIFKEKEKGKLTKSLLKLEKSISSLEIEFICHTFVPKDRWTVLVE